MAEDLEEQPELDLSLPPSFNGAPAWALELARQQRRDRHHSRNEMFRLTGNVRDLSVKLGEEPDADGKGGRGLIGDVRKMGRDVSQLMDLKKMGMGAVAAVVFFGALILLGVTHWIQSITGHGK